MAICPHCKKEVTSKNIKIEELAKKPFKLTREMFSCPHCQAILGFASNA